MEQIIGFALIGVCVSLFLKKDMPMFALLSALAAVLLILWQLLQPLGEIQDLLLSIAQAAGVENEFIQIVLKCVAIAYLTHFSAQLCKDTGEQAIGQKVELAGKILILSAAVPILQEVLSVITTLT